MLQVRFDGTRFVARLSIDEKARVQRAGFIWDEDARKWTAKNPRYAYRLLEFCDEEAKQEIVRQLPSLKISKAPEIKYSKTRDVQPYQHQIEGAEWVLSRRASYIAYEAGLGKTAVAPLCINTVDGPTIVVCPSFLKYNWEYELERWLIDFHTIQILSAQTDILDPQADIYILPSSLIHVHSLREQFFKLNRRFKYLFVDEAHMYKTPDARRTMSMVGNKKVKVDSKTVKWEGFHHICDHTINLSGTPMPNRPIELHALMSRHAPHSLNYYDKHKFGVRYCGGFESEWGWDFSGHSNSGELSHVMTRNYMLIKKLEECVDLPELLPPQFIILEDNRGKKLQQEEMHLLSHMTLNKIIELETQTNSAFKSKVEEMLEDSPEVGAFGFISELRKLLGLRKVPPAIRVIKEMLEETDKIVVFTWHKEVADQLMSALTKYRPLSITGKVKNTKRHETVKDFQEKKEHRILIANIQAAGVGLTLTAASEVLFVEPSWVPIENDQAISRCHRIGQTRPVRAKYLVFKNSLDHLILNAHQNKNTVIGKVIR